MADRRLNKKHMVIFIITMCFIIADRFLKILAITNSTEKILIKNWLSFSLHQNTKAAFSINFGFDIIWLAIIITLLAMMWLNYSLKTKNYFKSTILLALILGSLSNIFDRFIYGAVIDYFNFINLNVFNLADVIIVAAATTLLIEEFKKSN